MYVALPFLASLMKVYITNSEPSLNWLGKATQDTCGRGKEGRGRRFRVRYVPHDTIRRTHSISCTASVCVALSLELLGSENIIPPSWTLAEGEREREREREGGREGGREEGGGGRRERGMKGERKRGGKRGGGRSRERMRERKYDRHCSSEMSWDILVGGGEGAHCDGITWLVERTHSLKDEGSSLARGTPHSQLAWRHGLARLLTEHKEAVF